MEEAAAIRLTPFPQAVLAALVHNYVSRRRASLQERPLLSQSGLAVMAGQAARAALLGPLERRGETVRLRASVASCSRAALADALEDSGMPLNGVILMSTILNYFTSAPGSDAVFIGNLPSYAAIAWHFGKIAHKPALIMPG